MNYSPFVIETLTMVLSLLIPAAFIAGLFRSAWMKGYMGELLIRLSASFLLSRDIYHRIHNVTLRTLDGTTQIDHILVSRFGIFVVETKNMGGWIFGSEKEAQWTQKIYKNSYKFQNPLRQNYKHVKALQAILGVPLESIHSVVVFVGSSTFKTKMPPNVTRGGEYVSYIKSFDQPAFSQSQVAEIMAQIESERLQVSMATHQEHVQSLKTRSDPNAGRSCPKCGSPMILRTAKRGPNAGAQFWGCSGYPKCRITQNVS